MPRSRTTFDVPRPCARLTTLIGASVGAPNTLFSNMQSRNGSPMAMPPAFRQALRLRTWRYFMIAFLSGCEDLLPNQRLHQRPERDVGIQLVRIGQHGQRHVLPVRRVLQAVADQLVGDTALGLPAARQP